MDHDLWVIVQVKDQDKPFDGFVIGTANKYTVQDELAKAKVYNRNVCAFNLDQYWSDLPVDQVSIIN